MNEIEKNVKARELIAYEYTLQMLPDGWTATHTEGEFDRYDITATNGKEIIYMETKCRDITAESIENEGCIIDEEKVEYMANLAGKKAIIQFFPKSNRTYVWNLNEREKWQKKTIRARKNNHSEERVWKTVYYMPMDNDHIRNVDLTEYNQRWEKIITKLDQENEK